MLSLKTTPHSNPKSWLYHLLTVSISILQDPSSAGKLVIRFHIDFPQSIPAGVGDALEAPWNARFSPLANLGVDGGMVKVSHLD